MKDLEKYKEVIMYAALLLVIIGALFQQIQPKFVATIDLFNQIKSQTEVLDSTQQQLSAVKARSENKREAKVSDEFAKKIYETGSEGTIDSDATFDVLLEDILEISRNNKIKTHSIKSTIDPDKDVFIAGDKKHYTVCKIESKIISNYSDFNKFIRDLHQYPYLVSINEFEIYPYQKDKKVLLINLSLSLYAKKSEEEIAKEQQSAQQANQGNEQPPTP